MTAKLVSGPLRLEFAEKELVVPAFVFLLAAESWNPPGGRERVTERLLGYLDRHSRPWRLRTGLVALDGFRDVSLEAALRNLWSLWVASPTRNRAPVAWGRHDPETRAWLWSAAGDDQRLAFLELEHIVPQQIDAALAGVFTDAMWEVWLKRWLTCCKGHNEHRDVVGHVFAAAPPEIVRAAIRPGGLHAYRTPSSFAELWRSRPETMLELLGGDTFERVVHVAVTSPSQRRGEVLERIRGWSEHDKLEPRALSLLVGWLRSQVRVKREQQQELIGLLREFRL